MCNHVYTIHVVYSCTSTYNCRTMEMLNGAYMIHGVYTKLFIYRYVCKFMHMYMDHEYESVYEPGSNAFELMYTCFVFPFCR